MQNDVNEVHFIRMTKTISMRIFIFNKKQFSILTVSPYSPIQWLVQFEWLNNDYYHYSKKNFKVPTT